MESRKLGTGGLVVGALCIFYFLDGFFLFLRV